MEDGTFGLTPSSVPFSLSSPFTGETEGARSGCTSRGLSPPTPARVASLIHGWTAQTSLLPPNSGVYVAYRTTFCLAPLQPPHFNHCHKDYISSNANVICIKFLLTYLHSYALPVGDLHAQTYDGASNMAGVYKGCQAITSSHPLVLWFHCGAHCVNLVALPRVRRPQLHRCAMR